MYHVTRDDGTDEEAGSFGLIQAISVVLPIRLKQVQVCRLNIITTYSNPPSD